MLVTSAYAQSAAGADAGSAFASLWVFAAFFAIMYFLVIRPQRAQLKKRQDMLSAIRRGDSVITGGGILGKVTKVYEESGELEVEIAPNVHIRVLRSTISDLQVKGQPFVETALKKDVEAKSRKKASKKTEQAQDVVENDAAPEKAVEDKS